MIEQHRSPNQRLACHTLPAPRARSAWAHPSASKSRRDRVLGVVTASRRETERAWRATPNVARLVEFTYRYTVAAVSGAARCLSRNLSSCPTGDLIQGPSVVVKTTRQGASSQHRNPWLGLYEGLVYMWLIDHASVNLSSQTTEGPSLDLLVDPHGPFLLYHNKNSSSVSSSSAMLSRSCAESVVSDSIECGSAEDWSASGVSPAASPSGPASC